MCWDRFALHEKSRGQRRAAQPLEAQPSQTSVSAAVTLERSQSRLGFHNYDAYHDALGNHRGTEYGPHSPACPKEEAARPLLLIKPPKMVPRR